MTDGVLRRMVAIDPGDIHVGVAEFIETSESWECTTAYEMNPDEASDRVASLLIGGALDLLVIEEFRLYPDKALSQSWSEMGTAQLIGILRYLHRVYLKGLENGGAGVATELVMQPASIQEPTQAILRTRGVTSEAKARKAGPHALSAELHGWHRVMRIMENEEKAG